MRRDRKKRLSGRFISILAFLILVCSACPSFAASGEVGYLDQEPVYGVTGIRYQLLDTKNRAYEWEFPYTDNFFRERSGKFSLKFAQGSLGLALSAFRSTSGLLDYQYETYLKGAGFTDLYAFGYDEETAEDSLSGVIGMKKVDDFTVIAAVTCGQGYGKEWAGNLKVGKGVRHEGFDSASDLLEGYLDQYIKDHKIEGKKKLWLTGMSRAAAVANITAADEIERGGYDDVYAYLFGVPRTTKEPVAYSGIYNICGQYDPVAATPFQSWGFERYGMDLYTPAQESDSDYPAFARRAAAVGNQMADGFRNNPEVNYQLRLMMEALDDLFKTSEDYAERFQPIIIDAMRAQNNDDWFGIVQSAIENVVPKNPDEKAKLAEYADYMSFMVGQHLRADQRQIEDGSWNPDEPLEANLVIEHRPSTYIKWMFSQTNPARLFQSGAESRRITVTGDVSAEVYRDGNGVSGIDESGNVYVPGGGEDVPGTGARGVFLMRNGHETVISLPADTDYDVILKADDDASVYIFDILVSPRQLESQTGKMYMGRIHSGQYEFRVRAGESPDMPAETGAGEGHAHFTETGFTYSPAVVMSNELDATKDSYMSLSEAYNAMTRALAALAALAAVCVVTDIARRRRRRRGHPAFSDWFIIAPHLILITASALVTQSMAYYMFNIVTVRAQLAALTVFFVSLLALRGAIRSREPLHFLISAGILVLSNLTALYYKELASDSYSTLNMLAFFLAVALLSTLAVYMFKRETPEKSNETEEGA